MQYLIRTTPTRGRHIHYSKITNGSRESAVLGFDIDTRRFAGDGIAPRAVAGFASPTPPLGRGVLPTACVAPTINREDVKRTCPKSDNSFGGAGSKVTSPRQGAGPKDAVAPPPLPLAPASRSRTRTGLVGPATPVAREPLASRESESSPARDEAGAAPPFALNGPSGFAAASPGPRIGGVVEITLADTTRR